MDEIKKNFGTGVFHTPDGRLIGTNDLQFVYLKFKTTHASQITDKEAFTKFISSWFGKQSDVHDDNLTFEKYLSIRCGILSSLINETNPYSFEEQTERLKKSTEKIKEHCQQKGCMDVHESFEQINQGIVSAIKSKMTSNNGNNITKIKGQTQKMAMSTRIAYQKIDAALQSNSLDSGLLEMDTLLMDQKLDEDGKNQYKVMGHYMDNKNSSLSIGNDPKEKELVMLTEEKLDQWIKEEQKKKMHIKNNAPQVLTPALLDKLIKEEEEKKSLKIQQPTKVLTKTLLEQKIREEERKQTKTNINTNGFQDYEVLTLEKVKALVSKREKIGQRAKNSGMNQPTRSLTQINSAKKPEVLTLAKIKDLVGKRDKIEQRIREEEKMRIKSDNSQNYEVLTLEKVKELINKSEKVKGQEEHVKISKRPDYLTLGEINKVVDKRENAKTITTDTIKSLLQKPENKSKPKSMFDSAPVLTQETLQSIIKEEEANKIKAKKLTPDMANQILAESIPIDKKKEVAKKLLQQVKQSIKGAEASHLTILIPNKWFNCDTTQISQEKLKNHLFVGNIYEQNTQRISNMNQMQYKLKRISDDVIEIHNNSSKLRVKNENIKLGMKSGSKLFSVGVITEEII